MDIHPNMPVYKNLEEKKPKIRVVKDYSSGDIYETCVELDMHCGTHIDLPLHVYPNGDNTDNLDFIAFCKCSVLDMTHITNSISSKDLKNKNIEQGSFVFFKTKSSFSNIFDPDFVYLDASGAEYIKDLNVKGVGIDSLGIERSQPGHQTHKTLLGNGIIIIEGLRLSHVPEGTYKLIALPLKIKGVEAAPARIILIEE
jgi:arylformamidase